MKVRTGIEVSSQSDIGCVRQNNEDSFGYWEPEDDQQFLRKGRLAVVADGMGGYEGGQEASRMAVETLVAVYRDFAGDDPQASADRSLADGPRADPAIQLCSSGIAGHGNDLHGRGDRQGCARDADYDALYYVHVGDTRLYLIRDGQITKVTRDHSYVGRLVESGMISPEEAEHHPQRNILTAALGTNPDLIMDSPGHPEPLRPEDVLLICSDGLWGLVRDAEILDAVENKSAEQAGRELIELARERGGPDNITVEILRLR